MRAWIALVESISLIPRMWLGPNGESYDLDKDWMSHWEFVLKNQELMGVDIGPEAFGDSRRINSEAEANGWIRISIDTEKRAVGGFGIALSASSIKNVKKAIKWLQGEHYFPDYIEIEIDSDEPDFFILRDYDEIDTFLKYGKVKRYV